MTQPIQEPSTQRSVSGLAWGESQLARRPASVNTTPPTTTPLPWAKGVSETTSVSDGVYEQLPIDPAAQDVAPAQTDIEFDTDHFVINTRGMWLVSYYVIWQVGMNGSQQADFGLLSSGPPVNFISEVSPTTAGGTSVSRVCQPVLVTTTPKSTNLVAVQYGDPPSDAVGTIIITFLGAADGTFPPG